MNRKRLTNINEIIEAFKNGEKLYYTSYSNYYWGCGFELNKYGVDSEFWVNDDDDEMQKVKEVIKTGYVKYNGTSEMFMVIGTDFENENNCVLLGDSWYSANQIIRRYTSITREQFLGIE